MPCYKPLQAWRGVGKTSTGKRRIVFRRADGIPTSEMSLPCGRCIGCRLERSRQWAVRCLHESELYEDNCFITLTYDDEHLPEDKSINVREFQLFMKRLRKKYPKKNIRYFHCGEYGELCRICGKPSRFSGAKNACECPKFVPAPGRPHYHACLFNFDFPDKEIYKVRDGVRLYKSEILKDLWGKGFVTIGDVTFDSAAYVARYIMKKITGDKSESHYQGLTPEYVTMSRREGIGKKWFEKYKGEVYPSDFIIVNGVRMMPPKFYDKELQKFDAKLHEKILTKRAKGRDVHDPEFGPYRLREKEQIKKQRLTNLRRNLEAGNA